MDSVIEPAEALQLLQDSQVVALPTETVYGLAGSVDSEVALNKIFAIKKRPFFDPLILHVADFNMAKEWAQFDMLSAQLARDFWPGPLTLVLPKKNKVPDLVTNGGPTVALRAPRHPQFQDLLQELGTPLAAPSANMFGKTSPTTAEHVVNEFNGQVPVVDGGPCSAGIESTVVEMDPTNKVLKILRPGMVFQEHLQKYFADKGLDIKVEMKQENHVPGHLKNHYQPEVPLILVHSLEEPVDLPEELAKINDGDWQEWVLNFNPALSARSLYSDLRKFSKDKTPIYIFINPQWKEYSAWHGLLDRIEKASSGTLHKNGSSWEYSAKS